MAKVSYSTLRNATASVNGMLQSGFGVVTVMNAKVYDAPDASFFRDKKVYEILKHFEANETPLCYLETLKTATATTEGPTKTITGGQYANVLFKYGKTARLEIQDALGNAQALAAMTGSVIEDFDASNSGFENPESNNYQKLVDGIDTGVVHFGSVFAGPKTIIGDTFFIDQKSGAQVALKVIFYQFNPDSTFTLTQDAEGDATVFDMNGDLLTTDITVGVNGTYAGDEKVGTFYSIVPSVFTEDEIKEEVDNTDANVVISDGNITYTLPSGADEGNYSVRVVSTDDGIKTTVEYPYASKPSTTTTGSTVSLLYNGVIIKSATAQ